MNFPMTNEELSVAIKEAHWMTRNTATEEPTFEHVATHFAKLLEIQSARAEMCERLEMK